MAFQYLALLRGINVGGKNLVKMADLRLAFESMEFAEHRDLHRERKRDVPGAETGREELAARIESGLTGRFGIELKVVLLTEAHLKAVVEGAPRGFGRDSHLSDVIFVRKPLTVTKAMAWSRSGRASTAPGRGGASSTSRGSPRRPRPAGSTRSPRCPSTRT